MSKNYTGGLNFTWPTKGDTTWDITADTALGILSSHTHTGSGDGGLVIATNLSDYASGSWTPSLHFGTSGSVTYTVQSGQYVKIGKQITVSSMITVNVNSSASGTITIQGLPYTIQNTDDQVRSTAMCYQHGWSSVTGAIIVATHNGGTTLDAYIISNGSDALLAGSNVANGCKLAFSLTYFMVF